MEHHWKITREFVLPEVSGIRNVIKTIWFEVITTDGERTTKVDGRINLQTDDLIVFIEYEAVTEENRLTWIKNKYGDDYEKYNISVLNLVAPN